MKDTNTWRKMFKTAFLYTGQTFYDISDQLSEILFGLLDVRFGQIVPPCYSEHITFHIVSGEYAYSTDDSHRLAAHELLAVVEHDNTRLYVSRRPAPEPDPPKLNMWRKVFEAAFERTGDSFGNVSLWNDNFSSGFFDVEFGKPFAGFAYFAGRRKTSDHVEDATFAAKSERYTYHTYPSGYPGHLEDFTISDHEHKAILYVARRHAGCKPPRTNPLDNSTPPGITREEAEERTSGPSVAELEEVILGEQMRYHITEAAKRAMKIVKLQGDHNDGS